MINNWYFKFLIITPLFILFSCSEIEDRIPQNYNRNNTHDNYVSPYVGSWVGTYSGEVSGTLILNVSNTGSVEVIRTLNGKVEEVYYIGLQEPGGHLNPAPSPKGFTLYGSLYAKSGTWNFQNRSGNWYVDKK